MFNIAAILNPDQDGQGASADHIKPLYISALKNYLQLQKCLPKNIILFQNGLDVEQINSIAKYEAEQVMSCFTTDFSTNDIPSFTFIVVQKKNYTRLSNNLTLTSTALYLKNIVIQQSHQHDTMSFLTQVH